MAVADASPRAATRAGKDQGRERGARTISYNSTGLRLDSIYVYALLGRRGGTRTAPRRAGRVWPWIPVLIRLLLSTPSLVVFFCIVCHLAIVPRNPLFQLSKFPQCYSPARAQVTHDLNTSSREEAKRKAVLRPW